MQFVKEIVRLDEPQSTVQMSLYLENITQVKRNCIVLNIEYFRLWRIYLRRELFNQSDYLLITLNF